MVVVCSVLAGGATEIAVTTGALLSGIFNAGGRAKGALGVSPALGLFLLNLLLHLRCNVYFLVGSMQYLFH